MDKNKKENILSQQLKEAHINFALLQLLLIGLNKIKKFVTDSD
jgi:hypothetical protein